MDESIVKGSKWAELVRDDVSKSGRGAEGLPTVGQEGVELLVGGVVANAREDFGQVFGGFDVVGDAGADERVERGTGHG
jgi:hypothetical protein